VDKFLELKFSAVLSSILVVVGGLAEPMILQGISIMM